MTDRFERGKARLEKHERGFQMKRELDRKLGIVRPEETVKVPKIGEWTLATQTFEREPQQGVKTNREHAKTSLAMVTGKASALSMKSVHPFPQEVPLSNDQKIRMMNPEHELLAPSPKKWNPAFDAPFMLKPPVPVTEALVHGASKKSFAPGTTTTDLDSILKSKVRSPSRPLPPLKEREIAEEDTEDYFMPLEVFDDAAYEEYPLDELMKHPDAYSRYRELSGKVYWTECKVLSYDKQSGLFTIQWNATGKKKQVARFNLRFAMEDPEKFKERVEAAKLACKRYELQYRFDSRVSQMATENLPELSNEDFSVILAKAGISGDKYASLVQSLVTEVGENFKYMNNQFDFEYNLRLNPLIPDRDAFLQLLPQPPPPPESGLVPHAEFDFAGRLQEFIKRHLFANVRVYSGMKSIWSIFLDTEKMSFLIDCFEGVLPLDQFVERQFKEMGRTTRVMKGQLQEALEGVISTTVNEEMTKNGNKENERFEKMVAVTTRMLHTVMLNVVGGSLEKYACIFEKYIGKTPEDEEKIPKLNPGIEPQFCVDLLFNDDHKLALIPSLDTFKDQILSLLLQLENSVNDVPGINIPYLGIEVENVSYTDCIELIHASREKLDKSLDVLFAHMRDFLKKYEYLEPTLSLQPEEFAREFDPDGKRTLDDYRKRLKELIDVADAVEFRMQKFYKIGMFRLSCVSFKDLSTFHTNALIAALLNQMKFYAIKELDDLQKEFDTITEKMSHVPENPEELGALKTLMEGVLEGNKERATKMAFAVSRLNLLEEFQFEITNDECEKKYRTLRMPQKISSLMDETERMIQVERIRMIRELKQNQMQLETETLMVTDLIPTFVAQYQELDMAFDAIEQVHEIGAKLTALKQKQDMYASHEKLFSFDAGPCRVLSKLMEEFAPLQMLWELASKWLQKSQAFLDTPFPQIKPDNINAFVISSTKTCTRLRKDLQIHKILIDKVLLPLQSQIEKFKQPMPLVQKLRHPGIKTKHWEEISAIVGFNVVPSMEVSLQNFIDLHLERWNDQISQIASIAAQEYSIESSLDQMDNELQTRQFMTQEFRGTGNFILIEVDDIVSLIEDQLVTTQTLMTSPFIAPMKKRALERLQFLAHSRKTVDSWIQCQRSWLYLQPIFTGTSIQQKLHREARDWNMVDKTWSSIMNMTNMHPDFMNVMHRDRLYEELEEANKLLDSITQGLNAYLETKRHGFPRFFFLSNDELIAILSHTKDFNIIMKYMSKLFEYIETLTLGENNVITAMNDDGLETVSLVNQVDTNTEEIEDWLNSFEEEMKNTIKHNLQDALSSHPKRKRKQWIQDYPAQVILISNQIIWTQQVTGVLKRSQLRGVKLLHGKLIEQLDDLTEMIRHPLEPATRQVISCLLINEVHNRDIVSGFVDDGISEVDSFKWLKQLRYYWEDDTVNVRSINNTYEYSYEYAGNSTRLVITPLTDRCYQTLLSAFKQFMSGAPSGPAGTGKTETVRDCAKALGRSCVVYNCSEEVTPEQMSQFFAGLATSGAWSCFDEFNRINIEVLSVIAQQVRTIQSAIAGSLDTFVLDARTLKLNPNAAICITMNPGYAGRTELPDNLKALFRPCAMMVPDFAFIAEIMLFSGGFTTASVLAKKLVALFDLCRKQLSNAHHYDWGLRAMKSILTTAGKEKRNKLKDDEAVLLVHAIIDCTKPKLVSADLPIFDGIIHDVFPDLEVSQQMPEDFNKYISEAFKILHAQPLEHFVQKSHELYETSMLRHGIMLVGGPMGGKSICWRAVQKGVTSLAQDGKMKLGIHIDAINPKSITIPELYGLFDPITSGWSDGVLSSKIRENSMSDPTELKWIILDGPVDSLWIESMNSLLDDNKVLCLSNNERIALGNHVRMFFEVDDLSQASPATVSRCGMIFFDPSVLPWTAVADSWAEQCQYQDVAKRIRDWMNEYVPAMLQFVQVDAKMAIGANPLFLVKNMLKIIDCFMDVLREPIITQREEGDEILSQRDDVLNHSLYFSQYSQAAGSRVPFYEPEQIPNIFERIFIFSLVWSFGSSVVEESRLMFDRFLKDQMAKNGADASFPPKNTVFDWSIDMAKLEWVPWCDTSREINYDKEKPLEKQFIPTTESAAMMFLCRLLVTHGVHTLLQGPESSKTLTINTLMHEVLDKSYDCHHLPFANCSTSSNIVKVLQSFMQKRHGCYGPLTDMKLVIFLDNIGAVKPEVYGAQPPLELIRQFHDYGGWYDTKKVEFQNVVDTTLIAGMSRPGGGLFSIPDRLLRHFCYFHFPKLKKQSLSTILTAILNHQLDSYGTSILSLVTPCVRASLEIFEQCTQVLLPIPSKLHYIFSLRNIVRVIKGIMLTSPTELYEDVTFVKLWIHEMSREWYDRFNTTEDRRWFRNAMGDAVSRHFQMIYDELVPEDLLLFNGFADHSNAYKEVKISMDQLITVCQGLLEAHNHDASQQLDIVMFTEAVKHISAMSRVLSMPRGHLMLVGVKSSGRRSLARLAMHMSSMEPFTINITRTYNFGEWREDMKALMKSCGCNDLPTCFMISDSQIIGNFQLEDISNLLISSEIPSLFERDEIEKIKIDMVQAELLTDEDPWELFQSRVKQHLHIILVFSPYGSVFKESLLSFPALRTETTIDWFMPWSSDALQSVGQASLTKASVCEKDVISAVVNVFVRIHKSVEEASAKFLQETKRFTACTPSRFFELISMFCDRLKEKRQQIAESVRSYEGGMEKIEATRAQIEMLSEQLDRDIPILQHKKEEVEKMLKDLEVKQAEVEVNRQEVQAQSDLAEEEQKAAAEKNRIAQEQFEAARPILLRAQEAVDSMDKDSLVNIKTLKKIHPALRETFDAICIIFGRPPRRVDGPTPGTKIDDYWPESLALVNDVQFIRKVKGYEVEKMTRETVNKLKKYVGSNKKDRERKLQEVRSGYQAVGNLYLWVCASYDYWFVYQEILPKKKEADEAAAKLAESERVLQLQKDHLKAVENQLAALQQRVDDERRNEQELADNVSNTQLKLNRAQKIMSGLSGETKRWGECAVALKESTRYLLGDTLLVSAALTHLGAFSSAFRQSLISQWKLILQLEKIEFTESLTISSALGNDAMIRDWIAKGLPNDTHSIENGLIIQSSSKAFPLLIDPQLNGTKWLRMVEGEKLVVLRFDQPDFVQRMRACVPFGIPVLIENVGLKLDPVIDPLLSKEFLNMDGVVKVALGGEFIQYSSDFRLYLSTKYPNPIYTPEVCSQVTLINFTTTKEGLSDLLMNNLIEVEREDLDSKRIQIMEASAENLKKLKQIEAEILKIVATAGSDLLEEDSAVMTLTRVQNTSAMIEQQMIASAKTEKLIQQYREKFVSVAERASLLYFCASDFAVIDPMYQFSLRWFVELFKQAIQGAEHPSDPNVMIQAFNAAIARKFFESVSHSLFSRHKLLFSALMAVRILLDESKISPGELAFLLSPKPDKSEENPYSSWMHNEVWELLRALPSVGEVFAPILDHVKQHEEEWKAYARSEEGENETIPCEKGLSPFQKLIILRVFHLHRVREGIRKFVAESLGNDFVKPPSLNLTKVFNEASPLSPLIFVITPGIDPVDEVLGVAESMGLGKYLKCYSLGRGRGDGAEELIIDGYERGFWILLQNCHLSLSWMPRLEHIIDHLDPSKVHARFRLCLVTMSDDRFPIGILYQGTKLIYEIPKGIRENMLRIYAQMNSDEYDSDMGAVEKQLTFHLAYFHSIVLERLQFGSIGWNIPYEFNPSDFSISRRHLKAFLAEASMGSIPFEALSYVIGELNYGGRVTDAWDRRLLLSLLHHYFSEEILSGFTFGEKYPMPNYEKDPLQKVEAKIATWPIVTEGEDVGLSPNASTITARNDAMNIFNSLVEIQPTLVVASGVISEEQYALNMVEAMIEQIPGEFSEFAFKKKYDLADPVNTVLHHQILLFNNLLNVMKTSLLTLKDALKGLIVMDSELDLLNRRLLANRIPEMWIKHSYPSILTLRNYLDDLKSRVQFIDDWIRTERPRVFRVSAFFHPEEFLTVILQIYARKRSVSFDTLKWTTIVTDLDKEHITSTPEDGIYVEGLSIEGAKWDPVKKCLVDCGQTELISTLPILHLLPTGEKPEQNPRDVYECPVYRTQNRGTGALDLPNYIMSLDLPTGGMGSDHWIQRSVAVFITTQT